jgi:superfamily I DNA/RNA helicase
MIQNLSLNKEQKKAASVIHGPLLVLAGAGTGKTKVITSRIAHLICFGIPPEKIVAVSFTNKAAKEMQTRLSSLIGEKQAKKVLLSTFHAFALRLLRTHYADFSLHPNFSICDESESDQILNEAIKEENLEEIISSQQASEKIAYFKDLLYTQEDFKNEKNIFNAKMIAKLFHTYNKRLRLFNFIDFNDIIYIAVLGLKKNPSLRQKIQESFLFLMVDEYQDTSNAQFQLLCMLSSHSKNICVVGDDDQSIYSWRGAKDSIIQEFLDVFPEAEKVTLEQNYRCSPNILSAANHIIRENKNRFTKELWSAQPHTAPLIIHTCENERDEALFVAQKILEITTSKSSYADSAILIRSNNQRFAFEQIFTEKKIPYIVHGNSDLFDRKEIKDLFSYLKFACHPNDIKSLFRILNLPYRGVDSQILEQIKENYQSHASNALWNPCSFLEELSSSHDGIFDFLKRWNIFGENLKKSSNKFEIALALKECYENIGLKQDILKSSANMKVAKFRIDMIEKVFSVIENLELEKETLQSVVDALYLDKTYFDSPKKSIEKVQIMTIHSSKGLEFPYVFLVGIEDGILPHEKSFGRSHGIEEERRLLYVAMTRAKQRLFISHCGFRTQKVPSKKTHEPKISRFLSVIPTSLTQIEKTASHSEEAKRMESARKLFDLFH